MTGLAAWGQAPAMLLIFPDHRPVHVDTAAPQLAVFDVEAHGVATKVSVPNERARPGMETTRLTAHVAQRPEAETRSGLHERSPGFLDEALTDHVHSTPREKPCDTEAGHRVSPSELDGILTNPFLTPEKPAFGCFSSPQRCT